MRKRRSMEWDKHLAYEIRQLCSDLELLYSVWPEMHGATPTMLPEGIAYFEALLVHCRNLLEFLIRGPVHDGAALSPADFGLHAYDYLAAATRFENAIAANADEVYGHICTYVSHLSKDRDLGIPYWELQPIAAILLQELGNFATAVEAAGGDLPLVRAALEECG
jgi:hypothetical protein